MKRSFPIILVFAILILFFIQSAGTLVESIYIMDLMNTSLDEKALGVLFFFSPILLIPFYKKFPRGLVWFTFALAFVTRWLAPLFENSRTGFNIGAGNICCHEPILPPAKCETSW